MKRLTYQKKKEEKQQMTVAIVITKYAPFQVIITITHPQFNIVNIYQKWFKELNIEFTSKIHKINKKTLYHAFLINPNDRSFIDILIEFAYKQTCDVYIIDRGFNKDVAIVQLPTTEKFVLIDEWNDPKTTLTL